MVDVGKSAIRSSTFFTQALPSKADCRYSGGSGPFALAVTTKLYNIAEASALRGMLQKSHAFLPNANGLTACSAGLLLMFRKNTLR